MKKMRVTFLIPPVFDGKHKAAERSAGCTRVVYLAPNIYELTLAGVVEDMGHEVKYEDFVYDNRKPSHFKEFLKSDDSDVYCIWGVNLSIEDDVQAIALIRELRPEAYILLAGPGPTYFTHKLVTDSNIVALRGEPEATIVELLPKLDKPEEWSKIAGISYFNDGKLESTPSRAPISDIDALPFPARHLIAGRTYHNPKLKTGPYTTAFTSRNCPFKCIYCVPSSLTFAREIEFRKDHGRKPPISYRSIESVDRELAELHKQGYKAIGFMDDNFIWTEKRTLALCEVIKKYGFAWGCQARVDAITEPIAKALGESGCQYVDFGVESFDQRILDYIKKGITVEQIYNAVALLKKYNVPVKLNVLIGSSPYETKETIRHTLRKAQELDVDQVMFNIVSPFPGTEFYELAKENDWLAEGGYRPTDVQRESILNYPHLSSTDMEKALFHNNLKYFISWRFINKQLRRFRSWGEFYAALKALRVKLFG